jgi:hypothetical protein
MKSLKSLKIVMVMLITLAACDEGSMYQKEMYRPVIYLLSEADNTYTAVYTLNEAQPVNYFSIGCGGSLPNSEEVTVTLEPDNVLLDKYNLGIEDPDFYGKVLPQDKYEITSYTAVIPANSPDQYIRIPVKVRPEGLSPDVTYFIPLAIKSVSKYEVNPEKYNFLYRVVIENDYAEQKTTTYYQQKGTDIDESQTVPFELPVSGSKLMQPLAGDKVRVYAGTTIQTKTSTLADIKKYSLTVQVAADKSLRISPYGTIEVEQLSDPAYNKYVVQDELGKEQYYFYLYYRYRTLTTPATESSEAVWSGWHTIKETLRRLE